MLLAIDAGNTNIMFALVGQGVIHHRWRISTVGQRTADEYLVWLNQLLLMEHVDAANIEAVIIASVVPQTLFNLRGLARRLVGVEPMVVGTAGTEWGMRINMPNPAEVGADRIVNAVAARAEWSGALIIVDFGTATTFDIVSAENSYEGGVIAPGINLSMDALYRAAAQLPRVAIEPPASGRALGKGTVEAMQSGVFWGYIGLIEGLIARLKTEMGVEATVIATGGLAPLFSRHTSAIDHVDGDLTVKGLALLHALNSGK